MMVLEIRGKKRKKIMKRFLKIMEIVRARVSFSRKKLYYTL